MPNGRKGGILWTAAAATVLSTVWWDLGGSLRAPVGFIGQLVRPLFAIFAPAQIMAAWLAGVGTDSWGLDSRLSFVLDGILGSAFVFAQFFVIATAAAAISDRTWGNQNAT